MINCYIFIWKALSTRFCINFEVITISEILKELWELSVLHDAGRVESCRHLLLLFLLEDVQKRAMWGLDCYDQTLVIFRIVSAWLPP